MFPEQTIVNLLLANATVSGTTGGRIAPAPLGERLTTPAITYQRLSTDSVGGLSGHDGLNFADFTVDAWTTAPDSAWTLGSGIVTALTANAQTVIGNQFSLYEPDTRLYRASVSVQIPYRDH